MTFQYIYTNNDSEGEFIAKGLIEYNRSITGERQREQAYIYVVENDKLIGGMNASLGWDWIHFNEFFFTTEDVFLTMLNQAYDLFKEHAVGAMISDFSDTVVDIFKHAGYDIDGTIEDIPKGKTRYTFSNRKLVPHKTQNEYKVIVSKEHKEELQEEYKKQYDAFMEQHYGSKEQPYFTIKCMDQDTYVGGVGCIEQFDNIYVDLLHVMEEYRGNNIATVLMNKVEEEAINRGIDQIYLGTCSFQAPMFYEKLGYERKVTNKNFPKGFENYTYVKKLNQG